VVRAEAVLEFVLVVLDAPADLGKADQFSQRCGGGPAGQPVVGGASARSGHSVCRFCSLPSGSRTAIGWIDLRRPSSISPRVLLVRGDVTTDNLPSAP
jgi:hypothetical protein